MKLYLRTVRMFRSLITKDVCESGQYFYQFDILIEYYIYCEVMDRTKLVNTAIASHSYNPLHEVLMKT